MEPGDTTDRHYAIAIDIGTTTVWGQLLDLTSGTVKLKIEKTDVNIIDAASRGTGEGLHLALNVAALPPDGLAVLNADDPRVAAMASRSRAREVKTRLGI